MGPKKATKRGRPRKERPEDKPEYWEQVLHDHKLGLHRAMPDWLTWEWNFDDEKGRPLEKVGNVSITQQSSDELNSQWELAANETVVLSPAWRRFLEYMNVAAEGLSPKDNGAALKEFFLQDARARHMEKPIEIPAEAPSPAQLRVHLAAGELKFELDPLHKIIHIQRFAKCSDEPEESR